MKTKHSIVVFKRFAITIVIYASRTVNGHCDSEGQNAECLMSLTKNGML